MEKDTNSQIDKILSYLPIFLNKDFNFIKKQSPYEPDEDGVYTLPYFVYVNEVYDFFELLSSPFWTDTAYLQHNTQRIMSNAELIDECNLDQIKTLLTFCVRGERFCEGHWNEVIKSGIVSRILLRLKKLKDEGKIE